MLHRVPVLLAFVVAFGPATAHAEQEPPCDGMNDLGVEPELVCAIQSGISMCARRNYAEALQLARSVSESHPDSPVGPVCRAVIFQVIMFEEWDEEYEDNYTHELEVGRERIDRMVHDNAAWSHFVRAVVASLEALDRLHDDDHLSAVNRGWDALVEMRKARRADAEFADPDLFLGIFNYYLATITRRYDGLPSFADRRDEAFEQMRHARDEGLFTHFPGSFALAYCYHDHGAHDEAAAECRSMLATYPDNVLVHSLLARIQTEAGDAEGALAALAAVRRVDPENRRLPWYLGEANRVAVGDRAEARRQYLLYLEMPGVPLRYRIETHQMLATMAEEDGDLDAAIGHLESALTEDPKATAVKKQLKGLKKRR